MRPLLVFLDGTTIYAPDDSPHSLRLTDDGPTNPGAGRALPAAIIDTQLVLVGDRLTPQEQSAIEICLLYASAAARAKVKDASANHKAFFDALTSELTSIGFFATRANHETTTSGVSNLTDDLKKVANAALDTEQSKAFRAVNNALQTGAAPDPTLDVLRRWWTPSASNSSATVVKWGMIARLDERPSLSLLYLAFSKVVSPGDLPPEGVDVTYFSVTLALDMSIYKTEEASLRKALGGAISQYIHPVTLQV